MLIKIGNFEFTEVWDGVLYKKLSNYPDISPWEIRNLIEFIDYEERHGRDCKIECENADLLREIRQKMNNREFYLMVDPPKRIMECVACPYRRGCETEYVCHTTSEENAVMIFECGKLLSAERARGIPGERLMMERRNAAKDPADYFSYIMFSWGNCQAGDRLVMERSLGRFPNEKDLSIGFRPGIRFYFRYDKLKNHPDRVFDGVLPMKIKNEVILSDWVDKIIIPEEKRNRIEKAIPIDLKEKVIYLENTCKDIWDWSEKVYRVIETKQ